ncbi:MAG: DNA-deoxyinosine glycosylase [Oscillospiraceae bacterium]
MSFEPIYTPQSKILILGTYPSPLSFQNGFYYGNPRNRFWQLMAELTNEPLPQTNEEKIQFLLETNIALWDVLDSCDIVGAADSSIKNPVANDISSLLSKTRISGVFLNGAKAAELYQKYGQPSPQTPFRKLPSTSPANAAFQMERLRLEWSCILPFLGK